MAQASLRIRGDRARRIRHAIVVLCFTATVAAGAGPHRSAPASGPARIAAAPPEEGPLARGPLEPAASVSPAPPEAESRGAEPAGDPAPAAVASILRALTGAEPVMTTSAPRWLRNEAATQLWSSPRPDAQAFTDLPAGSFVRVQGPPDGGRWPVYYVGDGLLRRPGSAWVDAAAVGAVDPPAPGEVPEVDAYANRPLPTWVQAHRATTLWSGPDGEAVVLTALPQWTFLKALGLARGGRLLVDYAGDYAQRQPGIGWVDEAAVGPAGDPGRWVQNHRASALWSGANDRAERFTDLPQWTKLRVVDLAWGESRMLVEYLGDGRTRLPGIGWIARDDVGPITPPVPLPARRGAPAAPPDGEQAAPSAGRRIERYAFASQDDFIRAVGAAAQRSQRTTGVPASVAIAQAILESDWGRSRLARQANNLFGIKAQPDPGPAGTMTLPTWEHLAGRDVVVEGTFKAYHTVDESIVDHARFFQGQSYESAMAVADDPRAFARAIQEAGYATDPEYAAKLIRLMNRYDLYAFDAS